MPISGILYMHAALSGPLFCMLEKSACFFLRWNRRFFSGVVVSPVSVPEIGCFLVLCPGYHVSFRFILPKVIKLSESHMRSSAATVFFYIKLQQNKDWYLIYSHQILPSERNQPPFLDPNSELTHFLHEEKRPLSHKSLHRQTCPLKKNATRKSALISALSVIRRSTA